MDLQAARFRLLYLAAVTAFEPYELSSQLLYLAKLFVRVILPPRERYLPCQTPNTKSLVDRESFKVTFYIHIQTLQLVVTQTSDDL